MSTCVVEKEMSRVICGTGVHVCVPSQEKSGLAVTYTSEVPPPMGLKWRKSFCLWQIRNYKIIMCFTGSIYAGTINVIIVHLVDFIIIVHFKE